MTIFIAIAESLDISMYCQELQLDLEYCMLANCKEGSSYVHKHYAIFAVNMFFSLLIVYFLLLMLI